MVIVVLFSVDSPYVFQNGLQQCSINKMFIFLFLAGNSGQEELVPWALKFS